MIAFLRGNLAGCEGDAVLLDVVGVGYRVFVTGRTLARLPAVGEKVELRTHMHMREDGISLYGFDTAQEADVFRLLLGVSGVGPKVALNILGFLEPERLLRALHDSDLTALTTVPGVGRKTAQRLCLELKDKIGALPNGDLLAPQGAQAEALQALVMLGYSRAEAERVLAQACDGAGKDITAEDLIRKGLQILAG